MSKKEMIVLPREVVERALEALSNTGTQRGKQPSQFLAEGLSINALRAVLEQPQRKLTQQDIADSALLGNIESPFNGCMHQEHCKRWKAKAGADSSLRAAVQQACDWISEEPGRRPISAGRLLAILTNALAAAPQPPEHYDQQALDLCLTCGWKTMIPGDCCLNCARQKPPVADQSPKLYPLPADLYDSKDWLSGTYAERVEWLHTMYESAKEQIAELERPRPDATPYLYYDPENGDTWTQEAINDGFCLPDGLIVLYTKDEK